MQRKFTAALEKEPRLQDFIVLQVILLNINPYYFDFVLHWHLNTPFQLTVKSSFYFFFYYSGKWVMTPATDAHHW